LRDEHLGAKRGKEKITGGCGSSEREAPHLKAALEALEKAEVELNLLN
jgi:hypothetical protein